MTSSRRSLSPLSVSPHTLRTRERSRSARRRGPAGPAAPPLEHLLHLVGHTRDGRSRGRCRRGGTGRSDPAPCPAAGGSRSRRREPWPGAGCCPTSFGAIARTGRGRRSATASSSTSSTPITEAMASLVTSSCVGPSPPQTIKASASASIERNTLSIRATLSPTLTCSREAMPCAARRSPMSAELVSTI